MMPLYVTERSNTTCVGDRQEIINSTRLLQLTELNGINLVCVICLENQVLHEIVALSC